VDEGRETTTTSIAEGNGGHNEVTVDEAEAIDIGATLAMLIPRLTVTTPCVPQNSRNGILTMRSFLL
jgi:hypothetical protein